MKNRTKSVIKKNHTKIVHLRIRKGSWGNWNVKTCLILSCLILYIFMSISFPWDSYKVECFMSNKKKEEKIDRITYVILHAKCKKIFWSMSGFNTFSVRELLGILEFPCTEGFFSLDRGSYHLQRNSQIQIFLKSWVQPRPLCW